MDGNIIYELGYHLNPALDEGKVSEVVSSLKKNITDLEGSTISEEAPKPITLAYPISKFDKAIFGWIKFEMEGASLAKLNNVLQGQKQVIRFLIVKTDKENTVHFHKISSPKKEDTPEPVEGEKKSPVEEIDKSIEELVIN